MLLTACSVPARQLPPEEDGGTADVATFDGLADLPSDLTARADGARLGVPWELHGGALSAPRASLPDVLDRNAAADAEGADLPEARDIAGDAADRPADDAVAPDSAGIDAPMRVDCSVGAPTMDAGLDVPAEPLGMEDGSGPSDGGSDAGEWPGCPPGAFPEAGVEAGPPGMTPQTATPVVLPFHGAGDASGPRYYRVSIPPSHMLVGGSSRLGSVAPLISLLYRDCCASPSCPPVTFMPSPARSSSAPGEPPLLEYAFLAANPTPSPREFVVEVTGAGGFGLRTEPPASHAFCEGAVPLPVPTPLYQSRPVYASQWRSPPCGTLYPGGRYGMRFYSVTVPPGRTLEVSASGGYWSPIALEIWSSCAAVEPLVCTRQPRHNARLSATWCNLATEPRTVLVVTGASPAYDLPLGDSDGTIYLSATLRAP